MFRIFRIFRVFRIFRISSNFFFFKFFQISEFFRFFYVFEFFRLQFEPMQNELYAFVPGSEGGIRAIRKEFRKSEDSSFYVADDEKAICIDDLLKENSDKSLGVEFFLSLLSDLATLLNEEKEENLDLEQINSNKEEQLMQLEKDLDLTMLKLRRKLMVIRLLGLMSEDEKLQGEVMKNSERLIKFLCLTFQRCATLLKFKDDQDFEFGMAERQSLHTGIEFQCSLSVKMQAKCGQNAAKMQPKCSQNAFKMHSKCSLNAA